MKLTIDLVCVLAGGFGGLKVGLVSVYLFTPDVWNLVFGRGL